MHVFVDSLQNLLAEQDSFEDWVNKPIENKKEEKTEDKKEE